MNVLVVNTSTDYPCVTLALLEVENGWTRWSKRSFLTLAIHEPLCLVCSDTCGHFSIPGFPTGCYSNKLLQGEDYLLNMFTEELWKQQTFNSASKQASGVAVSGTLQPQGAIMFYKMAVKYYLTPQCFWKGYWDFAMQVAYIFVCGCYVCLQSFLLLASGHEINT